MYPLSSDSEISSVRHFCCLALLSMLWQHLCSSVGHHCHFCSSFMCVPVSLSGSPPGVCCHTKPARRWRSDVASCWIPSPNCQSLRVSTTFYHSPAQFQSYCLPSPLIALKMKRKCRKHEQSSFVLYILHVFQHITNIWNLCKIFEFSNFRQLWGFSTSTDLFGSV